MSDERMSEEKKKKQFVSCRELFGLVEKEVGAELERLTLCDLCPSLTLDDKQYRKVNVIIFDNGTNLILNHGVRDRGFTLYARIINNPLAVVCNDYLLYYKRKCVRELECPLTLNDLIRITCTYDVVFSMFLILGSSVNAMIQSRARDAWAAARDARDAWDAWAAAWDAWAAARDARDAWDAWAAAWDAWDAARDARDAWDAARAAAWDAWAAAWDARDAARDVWDPRAAWDAAKNAFRQTIKSIKIILKGEYEKK